MPQIKLTKKQPYQVLFPLGLVYSLFGVFAWILFAMGIGEYPLYLHTRSMMMGFLYCFSFGFLMTAIPRFTGTKEARPLEIWIVAFLGLGQLTATLAGSPKIGDFCGFSTFVILILFGLSRFSARKHQPPATFVFLPIGILAGLLGCGILFLSGWVESLVHLRSFSSILVFEAVILSFVVGVGGKLIPALLGGFSPSAPARSPDLRLLLLAALFVLGYGLELTALAHLGIWVRALVVLSVALQDWKILKRPQSPGYLTGWLWVSCWGVLLGVLLKAFFPVQGAGFIHLTYISGFGLMTLMIASRVTLSHGGYGTEMESKSKWLQATAILLILAALARVGAVFSQTYLAHLAYAAGFWIVGVLVWMIFFLPKILRVRAIA